MRQVVVAGATGLVGRELVRLLEARPEVEFTALVRRPGSLRALSGRVREIEFDYREPGSYARIGTGIPCDLLFCALGTTIKKAGSPAAFREVDLEFPRALIHRLAQLEPRPVFALVSSIGAEQPRGLYLSTKAALEHSLEGSGLPHVIVRPSLLLGDREEFRVAERISGILAKPFLGAAKLLTPHWDLVWRYAPIEATQVARSLVWATLECPPGAGDRILSGLALHHPITAL